MAEWWLGPTTADQCGHIPEVCIHSYILVGSCLATKVYIYIGNLSAIGRGVTARRRLMMKGGLGPTELLYELYSCWQLLSNKSFYL